MGGLHRLPKLGYWIEELGWTALGEHWEGDIRSRNHHFFGTPVQCMYEELAGIKPVEPGYKVIEFKPSVPVELENISVTYESVLGRVESSWKQTGEDITLNISVPNNSSGRIDLPANSQDDVIINDDSITFAEVKEGRVVYEVGAGTYQLKVMK